MNKDSKIYIAGHTGLVGSAILRRLQSLGYSNLIVRTSSELDLRDSVAVSDFYKAEKPEYIFLAAAKVWGILANNTFPAEFLYENLMIQNNVIHQAYLQWVKKLLFLGSSCIYPKFAQQPMKEEYLLTGPLEPTNEPYAIAKIAGIKLCQSYNRQYGTNFIACMPTNLYWQNDNFDLENSHVLPALIRKFHEAKVKKLTDVTLRGDGSPLREFLFVDDMADGCLYLMENFTPTKEQNENGDIFVNIGTGKEVSIKYLAELIQKATGYEGNILRDITKPNGTPRKLQDIEKLSNLWRSHKVELEEGIEKTYQRFLSNYNL